MNEDLSKPRDCVDCGKQYILSPRDQDFYARMMQDDPRFKAPKRCFPCRQIKRRERENTRRSDE